MPGITYSCPPVVVIQTLSRLRACLISHPEKRLGNPGLEPMKRTKIHGQMRPALTACSRTLSCPPLSLLSDVFLFPQVVHKAVLDVAETGTEAAAATGVKVNLRCGKIYSMTIYFNRPFLMIISDTKAHIALFMAKVTNPK